jgi:hypothetical protein
MMLIGSRSSSTLDASSSGCLYMGLHGRPLQTGLSLPLRCGEPSRVCWWSDGASLQATAELFTIEKKACVEEDTR